MSNTNELRLLSWNSDGVRSKMHELLELAVRTLSIDIIAVCETKLNCNTPLTTPGFNCYRQDKHHSGRGQGVAILVNDTLEVAPIAVPKTKNIEAVAISLKISGKDCIFVSAYQSPNLQLECKDMDILFSLGPRVVIMGDFNANHGYWNSSYVNARGNVLFRHMLEHDYVIHYPDSPTQVNYRPDLTPTNPDLILALNVNNIHEVCAIPALSSNHFPILFTVNGQYSRKPNTKQYRYCDADWDKYRSFLDQKISLDSKVFKSEPEIDCAVNYLHQCLTDARDTFIPSKVHENTCLKLPNYIAKMIKYKNYLRRKEQKALLAEKRRLRATINKLQYLINLSITKHQDKIWNSKLSRVDNPTNDIWRLAKSLKPRSDSIPPLKTPEGTFTTNIPQQCEALADAFEMNINLTRDWISDSVDENVQSAMSDLNDHDINELHLPVRPTEVWEVIRKLKTRKAPGDDGIHNIMLKNLSQKSVVFITKIFNGCLKLGYFPNKWKTAKVIPLKKPGKDTSLPVSYRPISLLPVLGKLFEVMIYNRLLRCSEQLIMNEQFGFRSSHSTVQQLARVSEHISYHLNLKQSTGMFLLDIEKAFDTVWHEGLLYKLISYGIPIELVKLIKSYLNNRKFVVHIGTDRSSPRTVSAGVPQGSVLGPYLFILFVSDVPVQVRTHLACFADDTASYTSDDDIDIIISRLQLSLELLQSYFNKWKLKLNESKTEAILFTRQRTTPKRKLNIVGQLIPWSTEVRYLGVTLDNKLNWTKHVNKLRVKGAQALGCLSPILNRKSKLSANTKLRLYTTLIRPCITYSCPVWSSTCHSNYNVLQTIQNKAVKIAYNTPFKTNLKTLHTNIKLPSITKFILKLTRKFYSKNKCHQNTLIANIGQIKLKDLRHIDGYGTYKLPHHYVLFAHNTDNAS